LHWQRPACCGPASTGASAHVVLDQACSLACRILAADNRNRNVSARRANLHRGASGGARRRRPEQAQREQRHHVQVPYQKMLREPRQSARCAQLQELRSGRAGLIVFGSSSHRRAAATLGLEFASMPAMLLVA